MARVTKEQKKKDEEKIIKLLLTQANESIDTLAKKCGFSRQKAWRIIKRLEEDHTIWGYHAVVDTEKLQLKPYLLLIKAAIRPVKDVADLIIKREAGILAEQIGVNIECSSYVNGPYDWVIWFNAKDTKHAKQFCHLIFKKYGDYIVDTVLLEEIFPTRRCGFLNPSLEKLREFGLFQ